LPWRVEGVAIDFLLGKGLRERHLAHQIFFRRFRRHAAEVDHRIEKGARGALHAQLQPEELPLQREEWQHDRLGVESPALGVRAVGGEHRASERHAALHHGGELQLVPGAGFMRGQRP